MVVREAAEHTEWHFALLALVAGHCPGPLPPGGVAADPTPLPSRIASVGVRQLDNLVARHPLTGLKAVWVSVRVSARL